VIPTRPSGPDVFGSSCERLLHCTMGKAAESVTLDEDVQEELRKLAERSGRPLEALANAALRDYVRYENQVGASIERGLADLEAGRTNTAEDVSEIVFRARAALSRRDEGFSREKSIERARAAVDAIRSRKR
jgi:predicted transcriptional regulator